MGVIKRFGKMYRQWRTGEIPAGICEVCGEEMEIDPESGEDLPTGGEDVANRRNTRGANRSYSSAAEPYAGSFSSSTFSGLPMNST